MRKHNRSFPNICRWNFLLALLASTLVVTGCGTSTNQTGTSTSTGVGSSTNQTNSSANKGAELEPFSPTYPGNYQTVELDGMEAMEGRFPQGKFGGTFVQVIVGTDPKTFNPWVASDTLSRRLGELMFRNLVSVDPFDGHIYPDLAKELVADKDGITFTTKLRKGLKWSDGKPITAEDVAFTWNTIIAKGYGNSSMRDATTFNGKSPQVIVVDELTNKFISPGRLAPFERLLSMPIAPKHVIEPILNKKNGREAFAALWSTNCDPKSLVTDGPFTLLRFVPGQRVEFTATKNFYMVDKNKKRLPYLQTLVFNIVPETNTAIMKFKNKELDINGVRPRDVVEFIGGQETGHYKLYNLGPSLSSLFLMFNLNQRNSPDTGKPYVDPVKSAWFNDLNFRQAVNHVINRKTMVANYFKGVGYPLFTSESPASPRINKDLKPFDADDKYAMNLLNKSGFKKHEDGFLYDKNNHKVEFTVVTSSGSTYTEAITNMLVEDLKKLGINANSQFLNFNTVGNKLNTGSDWDACIFAFAPGDPLEPNDGANVYKSDARLHLFDQRLPDSTGKITVNDARPWEKRLDEIYNQGLVELDKGKRQKLYMEAQAIIYEQAPFIYLVTPMVVIASYDNVGNFVPTVLSQVNSGTHNIEEIYKK